MMMWWCGKRKCYRKYTYTKRCLRLFFSSITLHMCKSVKYELNEEKLPATSSIIVECFTFIFISILWKFFLNKFKNVEGERNQKRKLRNACVFKLRWTFLRYFYRSYFDYFWFFSSYIFLWNSFMKAKIDKISI